MTAKRERVYEVTAKVRDADLRLLPYKIEDVLVLCEIRLDTGHRLRVIPNSMRVRRVSR